jgi:hypothetical protein
MGGGCRKEKRLFRKSFQLPECPCLSASGRSVKIVKRVQCEPRMGGDCEDIREDKDTPLLTERKQ